MHGTAATMRLCLGDDRCAAEPAILQEVNQAAKVNVVCGFCCPAPIVHYNRADTVGRSVRASAHEAGLA